MYRIALVAVALICVIPFWPAVPIALTSPVLLTGAVLACWVLFGPGCAIALGTVAWSVLNVGWVAADRLHPGLSGHDITIVGTICEFPRAAGNVHRFILQVARDPSGAHLPARVSLSWYDPPAGTRPAAGQRWLLKVRLKPPRGTRNPGAFDFERWVFARGIGATGYVRRSSLNRQLARGVVSCPLIAVRRHLASGVESVSEPDWPLRYLLALSVGAQHRLTADDWGLLRRTGTVHLMAISGLHIGLVAGLMLFVGRMLGRLALRAGLTCAPLHVGRVSALVGATGYAALAGFTVPTTRALVMVAVWALVATARRSVNPWQVLGAAGIAVLWWEPFAPYNPGFWLSFGAVSVLLLAGMAVVTPTTGAAPLAVRGRAGQLMRAQFALSLGLAPLMMWLFGEISLVAPLANLVVIPVFTGLIVPLTLLGTLCQAVSPWLGKPLLAAAAWLMQAVLDGLTMLDGWPASVWQPALPGSLWMIAIALGMLVLIWPRPLLGRGFALLPLLAVLAGVADRQPPPLRLVVMDVGQGLAVLVQTPHTALLYDAGPRYRTGDAGQAVVIPVLRYFGVERLDTIVVSHGDADHAGGVRSVRAVFPNARLLATAAVLPGIRRRQTCRAGLRWRADGVRFEVLHPQASSPGRLVDDNDHSCVLSIRLGETSILLPGDIEQVAEAMLLRHGLPGPFSIVVAPHHGSATSSSAAFVAATRPEIVIFSTGFGNRWHFPAQAVAVRWHAHAACLLNTAVTGALVFEFDTAGRLVRQTAARVVGRRLWTAGSASAALAACGAPTNYSGPRL